MNQTQYKNELKSFFANLSRKDSEATKLKKIDALRKKRGINKHLRVFSILFFALFSFTQISLASPSTLIPSEIEGGNERYNKLAESFRSGKFEIWQMGDYIQYLIEFLIYLGGGLSVLFVAIGGYQYMVGSISDDKESGKKTIMYALGGFAVSVLAWVIVNFTQVFLTSGGGNVASTTSSVSQPQQVEATQVASVDESEEEEKVFGECEDENGKYVDFILQKDGVTRLYEVTSGKYEGKSSSGGVFSYEGEIANCQPNGKGKSIGEESLGSMVYEGDFKNGIWDGKGKVITNNYSCEGDFSSDEFIGGIGSKCWMDGRWEKEIIEGGFEDLNKAKDDSIVRFTNYKSSCVFVGKYKNNKPFDGLMKCDEGEGCFFEGNGYEIDFGGCDVIKSEYGGYS